MHTKTKDDVFVLVVKVRLALHWAWERACGTLAATAVRRRCAGAVRADYIAEGNRRMKG